MGSGGIVIDDGADGELVWETGFVGSERDVGGEAGGSDGRVDERRRAGSTDSEDVGRNDIQEDGADRELLRQVAVLVGDVRDVAEGRADGASS